MMSATATLITLRVAARTSPRRRPYAVWLSRFGLTIALAAALYLWSKRQPAPQLTLHAVRGRVLVDGVPAENVNVAFHPLNVAGRPYCPVGRTDDQGVFHLTTCRGPDGAPAGEYSVTLVWPDGAIDECDCPDPTLHDRLRGTYANADESTFQVRVRPTGNTFWFNVSRPPNPTLPFRSPPPGGEG
jgi:hypothetical protein